MSHEYNDQKRTPEIVKDSSVDPSGLLAVDSLSEVSLKRRRQAAVEKYGDDLDYERSQTMELKLQEVRPFVSVQDVVTWAGRTGNLELLKKFPRKYLEQAPPAEEDFSENFLTYGIYQQAWERVHADREDLAAWTVLRLCEENSLTNRKYYYKGQEYKPGETRYDSTYFGVHDTYEVGGQSYIPASWETRLDVNFEIPSFEPTSNETFAEVQREIEVYEELVARREANLATLRDLLNKLSSGSLWIKDSALSREVNEFTSDTYRSLAYMEDILQSRRVIPQLVDQEAVKTKMRGDFVEDAARAQDLYEKMVAEFSKKEAAEATMEALQRSREDEWRNVMSTELAPIIDAIRRGNGTIDGILQLEEITNEFIKRADSIRVFAEKAANEAGLEPALTLLQSVQGANYGRAGRLADIAEYFPNLATEQQYNFSRASDLTMYLRGAVSWLEHARAAELENRRNSEESELKNQHYNNSDEDLDALMQQLMEKYNTH